MNSEKTMWTPKIGIQKSIHEHQIKKFDAIEDREIALKIAENIFDKTEGAVWFGVEKVRLKL